MERMIRSNWLLAVLALGLSSAALLASCEDDGEDNGDGAQEGEGEGEGAANEGEGEGEGASTEGEGECIPDDPQPECVGGATPHKCVPVEEHSPLACLGDSEVLLAFRFDSIEVTAPGANLPPILTSLFRPEIEKCTIHVVLAFRDLDGDSPTLSGGGGLPCDAEDGFTWDSVTGGSRPSEPLPLALTGNAFESGGPDARLQFPIRTLNTSVPLVSVKITGTFVDDKAGITGGTLEGFIRKSDADIEVTGVGPLSALLPTREDGDCDPDDDKHCCADDEGEQETCWRLAANFTGNAIRLHVPLGATEGEGEGDGEDEDDGEGQ